MSTLVEAVVTAVPLTAVPPTSEISSEVQKLTVQPAPATEVDVLVNFSTGFKSFNQSLTPTVRAAAIKLKLAFNVRQGKAGTHLLFNGEEMDWKKFVDKYFGITPKRFNQILDLEEATDRQPGSGSGRKTDKAADDASLAEKLDELDKQCHDLQAQLDDPVECAVSKWHSLAAEDVHAELTRIIDRLNLGDRLSVELY
jgi:hypothetical protein